jgi:predicted enzyme related to lactoylglutathione lyase
VTVTEFLSCRTNLEVDDLAPATAFLREVLGFEVEVDEPGMGLVLLRRDAVGLALVRSATPGVNATTAAYIGVTGVDELHEQCGAAGARIVAGLTDHPWGLRDFVIEIPGGHRLALGERITQPRLCRQEPPGVPSSESRVKRGDRIVGIDTELLEKLGRNDPGPCGAGRRFPPLLPENRPLRRRPGQLLRPGPVRHGTVRGVMSVTGA